MLPLSFPIVVICVFFFLIRLSRSYRFYLSSLRICFWYHGLSHIIFLFAKPLNNTLIFLLTWDLIFFLLLTWDLIWSSSHFLCLKVKSVIWFLSSFLIWVSSPITFTLSSVQMHPTNYDMLYFHFYAVQNIL